MKRTQVRKIRVEKMFICSSWKGSYKMSNHGTQEEKSLFIDNQNLIPITVIATFNLEGKMVPLYFAVEGIRIRIDRIVWARQDQAWGSYYKCEISPNDHIEEVELFFYKSHYRWLMKKKWIH